MSYLLVPMGIPWKSVAERCVGKQREKYVIFWFFFVAEGAEEEEGQRGFLVFPPLPPLLPLPPLPS